MNIPDFHWPDWDGPVDLEIGAGAGLFAVKRSLEHPERLLISLERTTKYHRLARRLGTHGSPRNAFAIRADAVGWIAKNVPARSIDSVFILYPNPYPRPRHSNLRWASMPFMGFLVSRLKPGGRIVIASNLPSYIAWTRRCMPRWGLQLLSERRIIGVTPRTHFEKKYLERGDSCVELVYGFEG